MSKNDGKRRRPRASHATAGRPPGEGLTTIENIGLDKLRRRHHYELVDPESLHIPEFEADPQFMDLWGKAVHGVIPVTYTRLDPTRIAAGFLRNVGDLTPVRDPPLDARDVDALRADIRRGSRPPIVVYEVEGNSAFSYVCSDDEAALEAYRSLGVSRVPVHLLGTPTHALDDACLEHRGDGGIRFNLVAEVAATRRRPLVLKVGEALLVREFFDRACVELDAVIADLRAFHLPGGDVHYHETLMSTLIRAKRAVKAIASLLKAHDFEIAVLVCRALYELSLSHYVDWVAPETIGPVMVNAARIPERDTKRYVEAAGDRLAAEGHDPSAVVGFKAGVNRLFALVRRVARKAGLAPGANDHPSIYHELSIFAHHDAVAASFFTGYVGTDLTAEQVDAAFAEKATRLVAMVANWSAGLILDCARSEIGHTHSRNP
jgi:hypothetical protein